MASPFWRRITEPSVSFRCACRWKGDCVSPRDVRWR